MYALYLWLSALPPRIHFTDNEVREIPMRFLTNADVSFISKVFYTACHKDPARVKDFSSNYLAMRNTVTQRGEVAQITGRNFASYRFQPSLSASKRSRTDLDERGLSGRHWIQSPM